MWTLISFGVVYEKVLEAWKQSWATGLSCTFRSHYVMRSLIHGSAQVAAESNRNSATIYAYLIAEVFESWVAASLFSRSQVPLVSNGVEC